MSQYKSFFPMKKVIDSRIISASPIMIILCNIFLAWLLDLSDQVNNLKNYSHEKAHHSPNFSVPSRRCFKA